MTCAADRRAATVSQPKFPRNECTRARLRLVCRGEADPWPFHQVKGVLRLPGDQALRRLQAHKRLGFLVAKKIRPGTKVVDEKANFLALLSPVAFIKGPSHPAQDSFVAQVLEFTNILRAESTAMEPLENLAQRQTGLTKFGTGHRRPAVR